MCDLKNASLAVVLFLTTFAMTSFADVKLTDTDTETLGNWVGVYGKNGAVVFIAEGKGVQHGGVAADEVIKEI